MIVEAYRNLHRECFSVRDNRDGRVFTHSDYVMIGEADLVVRPGGRRKVIETGNKNVHAFVKGRLIAGDEYMAAATTVPFEDWTRITYNPYQNESFVIADSKEPIRKAGRVWLRPDGAYCIK